jgi:hypothetical protein
MAAMIISRVSVEDLEAARDVASQVLGNELIFSEFHSYGPKRHGLRLQVKDIDGPGARRHSYMYMLGHAQKPGRSRFACTHAYGHLFVALFERCPEARVHTAMADYRGARDFLEKYPAVLDTNVGSMMFPLRYGDECTCETDIIPTDTLTYWQLGLPELPDATNTVVMEGA